MKALLRNLIVPAVMAFAVAGCGGDDPIGPGNGGPPPDISGTYDIVSFTQGGFTLTPPAVSGTFTVGQTSSSDTEASGTISLDITVPDGMGGFTNIVDAGTYTIRSNGSWEQDTQQQALGTYSLVGNTLTVTVTEPAQAASTSVWQRQ
ncbi:MAG: hypothetical protein OEU54_00150 [Gemmatimonadota bacterium]|nr:hypothetical protein [Gemmatimonadota bacterium]